MQGPSQHVLHCAYIEVLRVGSGLVPRISEFAFQEVLYLYDFRKQSVDFALDFFVLLLYLPCQVFIHAADLGFQSLALIYQLEFDVF